MANVSITDSSVLPKSITITEDGKTLTISETKQPVDIVVDQLTVTESPAALNDISDVEITSIADDQILVYDSTSGKWKNEANAGGGGGAVDSVNGQTGVVVLDTDDIQEDGSPTNKYFTTARVDAHLVGGTGVTYSAGNISIGQPVAITDDVTFNEVEAVEFIGTMRGPMLTKCSAGENLTKGDAVYISGISGNTPLVNKADANDSAKMPAMGLVSATTTSGNPCDVYTFGQLTNLDTTQNIGGTWTEGDSLYVSTTPGVLTKTQPSGETSQVQKIAKIEKVHASTGILLIQGAGRSNATPNLDTGNIFIGDGSNYATTSSLDTEVSALGYITASSTDTLTNKSGNISQWTNDAGYLTSETDSQTLSFASPNLSISNGNSVDISAITSGYLQNVVEDTTPELGGNLDAVSTYKIVNLVDPTSNQDAATKAYVDSSGASGISAVVDDTSPQLGGDLDVLGQNIFSSTSIVKVNDGLQILAGNSLRFENTAQTQNVTISGTLTTTGYDLKLPTTAPAASQYLTVDAAGQLTFSNVPTVITNNNQLTNGAGYITASSSDALTNKTGNISQWTNDSNYLLNVIEDTTPQLGGALDLKGQIIGPDSTRNYQIIGNQASPSNSDYDSFSNTNRVYGVVNVAEVVGPSNRVHSHPTLTKVTATANSSNASNPNPGRIRSTYSELSYDLDGFDNTTTGFGRGANNGFYSCMVKNDNASNNASTLTEHRSLVVTPQAKASSTGGLTITDMRGINMEPNINSGAVDVTTMYGMYYNSINDGTGTVSNQYSFYGNVADASIYNAGGFQMPVVTVSNLSTLPAREGNTAYVTDNTAGTGSVAKCLVFYDGSNWKLAHDPGTTAA